MKRRTKLARWLLERCAPADAEIALADLEEETSGQRDGPVGRFGHFWYGLVLVCAWGVAGRVAARLRGPVRPVAAARMALRGLRRTPGIAGTAALTLGVGLTAAVALLGIFFGSFRPLPVPGGEDIVQLRVLDDRAQATPPSQELLLRWRQRSPVLLGVGATLSETVTVVLDGGGALRASAARLSPDALEFLGIPPVQGRLLTTDPADGDAVVLRRDVWAELSGGSGGAAGALGASVQIDGVPHTVIGLMPEDFGFPEHQSVWRVLRAEQVAAADQIVARLRPGTDRRSGAASLALLLTPDVAVEGAGPPTRVRVLSYVGERGESGERYAFGALGVLVGILLVICTANASTLMLVRASDRVRTLAVHSALGASRLQVVAQLLLESALVAGAGGLLGLLGGGLILRWAEQALAPHWGYYWMQMGIRPGVLLATAALVSGCALVAGTVPALRAVRSDLRSALLSGGRGDVGGRGWDRWFTGAQIALSTTGLVVALILARGFVVQGALLESIPMDRIAVGSVTLDADDPAEARQYANALSAGLSAIPGAAATTVSVGIPGYGGGSAPLRLEHAPGEADGPPATTSWMAGDAGFLETFGLDLLQGRGIQSIDTRDAAAVAVVTRSFVERWLPPGNPLGRRIRVEGVHPGQTWAEIVGVVEDYHPRDLVVRNDRVILPLSQVDATRVFLSARTTGDPVALLPALRSAVREVDPSLALERAEPMSELVAWLVRMPRTMSAFGAAGGFAGVVVASIGLFGVLSFRVRRRLPAVGVRMALGAGRGRIAREILSEGAVAVLPWIGAGLILGLLISPATVMFSFGVPFRDPWLFLVSGLLMVGVALTASLLPALRPARLDPLTVLREE